MFCCRSECFLIQGTLSIQQKFQCEISHAEWNGSFWLNRPNTARFFVLVSRIQRSGSGDNDFVNGKGHFGPTD